MSAPEIVPFDWPRLFLGDAPPLFLLEIAFRTVFLYSWLLLLLRVVGRRGLAQLTVVEFGIVIALGSAAGDGLFYPEVPLVHAMIVILVVVLMQWGLAMLINRSERVETFMEGRPIRLVANGRVDLAGAVRARLSTEELFERLRQSGVAQLGEVRFAFFEQSGELSIFRFREADVRPGLPLVPPHDLRRPPLPDAPTAPGPRACLNCGEVRDGGERCPRCDGPRWMTATLDPLGDAERD